MTRLTTIAISLAVAALSGCTNISDPATPCRSMDLGYAAEATFVTPSTAPVVAVTSDIPFVLHEVCILSPQRDDVPKSECHLRSDPLPELSSSSPVLLTSTGRYAVAIDAGTGIVRSYEITSVPDGDGQTVHVLGAASGDQRPHRLVASLRGNDYIVTRDLNDDLARYLPGDQETQVIADGPKLLVVAVGERYLVGRQIHSGGEESLFLVPVHPDVPRSEPIRLARGATFSRVLLTPGDERIVATSGQGEHAQTLVFSVPDGVLIDRFAGAAVSGRKSAEEMPGLRGVSPDGSHVAYRTPTGALAMRSLDTQASCLVRSSTAGDHTLAGFAPNGVLYMEADEGVGESRILAFDPLTRQIAALGEAQAGYHLAAVAARMPGDPADREAGRDEDDESSLFWAVGVRSGSFAALQSDGHTQPLGLDEVSFMARDDGAVWLLNTSKATNGVRSLAVRQIAPIVDDVAGQLRFEKADESGPGWKDGGVLRDEFVTELSGGSDTCASTGIPGAWAYRCSNRTRGQTFFASDSGETEDPNGTPQPDPPDPS